MFHHTSAVAVLITYTHLGVTMYVIGLSRWFSPLTVFVTANQRILLWLVASEANGLKDAS
jgi:hypothetical protein